MPENPYKSPEAELPKAPVRSPWKQDLIELLVVVTVALTVTTAVIALFWRLG